METTHVITFFFGSTGSIKQYWDKLKMEKLGAFQKDKITKKIPTIASIAMEVAHDMQATRFHVETV